MTTARRIRVLHVVACLDRGGLETWLRNLWRVVDRRSFEFAFVVSRAGTYDEEIRATGAEVHVCEEADRPWAYAARLARILREHGPFDVVHSHVQHYGGIVLLAAAVAGVSSRVAHSHTEGDDRDRRWPRVPYTRTMSALLSTIATHRLAVTAAAGRALFGRGWGRRHGDAVLRCGVDLEGFRTARPRDEVRRELGIPGDALVVGHVGRFEGVKNHDFLVDVARELVAERADTRLLLVGDGETRPSVEARVRALGLSEHVVFTGARGDVADLLAAMDAFVLPSRYEGLPLAAVEAQASGVPVLLSDAVSRDAWVVPAVRALPLADGPRSWARAVLALAREERSAPPPGADTCALQAFDVREAAARLCTTYSEAMRSGRS